MSCYVDTHTVPREIYFSPERMISQAELKKIVWHHRLRVSELVTLVSRKPGYPKEHSSLRMFNTSTEEYCEAEQERVNLIEFYLVKPPVESLCSFAALLEELPRNLQSFWLCSVGRVTTV